MASNTNYRSYLLRIWRDNADHPWRASLQSTLTEEKIFFTDPLSLIHFLAATLTPEEIEVITSDEVPPPTPPMSP